MSAAAGTRAGNPLGDIFFNLWFAVLLRAIWQELAQQGLLILLTLVSAAAVLARPRTLGGILTFSDASCLGDGNF